MIRAGVPQSVAVRTSGHRTISKFNRYNIASADDQREALRRVETYLHKQPSLSNVVPLERQAQ